MHSAAVHAGERGRQLEITLNNRQSVVQGGHVWQNSRLINRKITTFNSTIIDLVISFVSFLK